MWQTDVLSGQTVLITGASSGIGAATARQLAAYGADVILAARSEDDLTAVAETCRTVGGDAYPIPTDVTDPDAVAALVTAAVERCDSLDGAVINAGVGEARHVPLPELPQEQFERVTETNVHGAFYTVQAVLPHLRETAGSLIFVGSYKAKYPSTSTPVYAASKWWLRGFALSVAGRVGPDGVAVTLVNPSGVPTAFGSEFRAQSNVEALDPDTTLAPEDVANAIVYAVSQDHPVAVTELDINREDILARF